jgi:hypothetical protein
MCILIELLRNILRDLVQNTKQTHQVINTAKRPTMPQNRTQLQSSSAFSICVTTASASASSASLGLGAPGSSTATLALEAAELTAALAEDMRLAMGEGCAWVNNFRHYELCYPCRQLSSCHIP